MRQGEKYKQESAWKFKGINCLPAVRVVIKFSLLTSALLRLCEINLQTHCKLPLLFILVLKPANPKQCAEKHWHASGSHPTKNVNLEKCHETFFPSLLLCNIFSLVYSSDQDRTVHLSGRAETRPTIFCRGHESPVAILLPLLSSSWIRCKGLLGNFSFQRTNPSWLLAFD